MLVCILNFVGSISAGFFPVIDSAGNVYALNGIQSVPTIQSVQNIQSYQGIQGLQGIQGIQSVQGIQNVQGIQGIQNVQEIQNLQGLQGIQTIIQNTPQSDTKRNQNDQQAAPISYTPTGTAVSSASASPTLIPIGKITPNGQVFFTSLAEGYPIASNLQSLAASSYPSAVPTGTLFIPSNAFVNVQTLNQKLPTFGATATASTSSFGNGNYAAVGSTVIGTPQTSGSLFTTAGTLPLIQAAAPNRYINGGTMLNENKLTNLS